MTQTAPARDRSLNEVRAVIPAACYERPRGRALLTVAQAPVLYLAAVAGLLVTDIWWLLVPLWVLAGLGVAGLFVLGHDASHNALVDSGRANRALARLCMAPSAHIEAAWDVGHNRIHHGYTTRQGFDFVWHPLTPDEYRQLGRLGRLQHRVELSGVGAGVYYLRTVWWQKMMRFRPDGRRRRTIRAARARLLGAVVAAVTAAGVLGWFTGGPVGVVWLPVKVFAVPFLVFVQVIGWTVYVHHVGVGIRWWQRREWNQFKGQMESTTIPTMPAVVNRLWFHNIFVNVPHHVDPRIPFHQLPAAADAIVAAYPDIVRVSRFSFREYLRTTRRCKLYDFESGCWLPYAAATSMSSGG